MNNENKEIVLDLGCKNEKSSGAIGVDIDPSVNPDVVHDFNVFPYPFKDPCSTEDRLAYINVPHCDDCTPELYFQHEPD